MVIAGLKSKTKDLDLFTNAETFDAIVTDGLVAEEERPGVMRIRLSEDISIYKTWPGVPFWEAYTHAGITRNSQGMKVASLHHVLAFKLARNEPKDATDIEHLRAALNSTANPFWSRGCVREQIDVWYKYEEIAMHFNDLLLRLRTQALGGLAALATVIALFSEKIPSHVRGSALRWIFAALAIIWVAIAIADQFYYQRLLVGAVDAIRVFERELGEAINLSTTIERRFRLKGVLRFGPIALYGLIFLALSFAAWKLPALG
jgi:hypothetical protein